MTDKKKTELWYDVYDGETLVQVFSVKVEACRKVFAENCSYRNEKDKTWYIKERVKNDRSLV